MKTEMSFCGSVVSPRRRCDDLLGLRALVVYPAAISESCMGITVLPRSTRSVVKLRASFYFLRSGDTALRFETLIGWRAAGALSTNGDGRRCSPSLGMICTRPGTSVFVITLAMSQLFYGLAVRSLGDGRR